VNLPARGRAVGKVILLGEHAVVYGRPALAAGLGIGLEVEVREGQGPAVESDVEDDGRARRLVEEAATIVGLDPSRLIVRVRSELPAGAGLGSSAALSIAVLRALARAAGRRLSTDEELAHGRRLEAIFHGHPSGIDPAAAALGTCFRFVRGEPPDVTPLRLARLLRLVIALGDRPRSTGAAVGGLRARWEADRARYERLFDDVASVVEAGARAAAAGDLATLGETFRANQVLLRELGVSAAAVEELVAAAEEAGALGAKLTGGGAGGAAIAVAAEPERVAATLRALGIRTIVVEIGAVEEAAA
jgi:mevalonate kinase